MRNLSVSVSLLCLFFLMPKAGSGQTYQTFDATNTSALTANKWSAGSGTNACAGYGISGFGTGNIAYFCTASGTGNGSVAISVGGIIVTENYTHSGGSDNTLSTGGAVVTVDVASGKTFVMPFNWLSNTSGTGFIKNGSGTWTMTGSGLSSNYDGGFTLNAGTVIARPNSSHAFGMGPMVINGGTIESQGTYTWTPSGLTIGGDFSFTGTGGHIWDQAVGIGTSIRSITNSKTNGTETFSGIISGSGGGITYSGNSATTFIMTGANTYTGLTTVSGSNLQYNRSGGGTLPSTNNVTVTGGTLQISSNQTLNDVTLTGGTLLIDDGVTLTINGSFNRSSSTTVTLSGSGSIQYGGSSTLTFSGSSSQTASTSEFPSSNGPNSITINNSAGVVLPSSFNRTINGTLTFASGKLTLGTSNLILANGSTISGASSSNYIVTNSTGYLQRNNVITSTDFPVGNSTYNPINIVNSGTADNFTVNVADDVLDAGTSGSALTANAVDRTWTVTEGTGGGSNVTLTAQWNTSDELTSFTRSSCYLSHYNGGWDATTAGAASGGNPYTISRSGITTFSPFGVGSGGALPVLLVHLKATKINETALITWATATELNNDYFIIERKTPLSEYQKIGTIKGSGNSNMLINYSFTDKNPVTNSLNYYRIVQHDFNGTEESFGPVSVRFGNPISQVTLLPNPFDETLTLNLDDESEISKIAVKNILGELIFEQPIEGRNALTINTETWKPGNYFIAVSGPYYFNIYRQVKF